MRPPPPARRRAALAAALTALAAACGACSPSGEAPAPPPREPRDPHAAEGGAGVVERVVDGDTLIARISDLRVRVRLLGVDAPETTGYGAECYGPESTRAARRLLPRGAQIALITDGTQGPFDRFGRRLAEVTVHGDRRTVNEALIAEGAAEAFRGDGRARLLPALLAAERTARDAGRGLWSACRGG
jgi:micrococcal nuclease